METKTVKVNEAILDKVKELAYCNNHTEARCYLLDSVKDSIPRRGWARFRFMYQCIRDYCDYKGYTPLEMVKARENIDIAMKEWLTEKIGEEVTNRLFSLL